MHIRTKARITAGLWLLGLAFMSSPTLGGYADRVERFDSLDFQATSQSAQDSFDVFVAYAFDRPGASGTARVKVDRHGKPVWLRPHKVDDAQLVGVDDSHRAVLIRREDVHDWSIVGPDGRLYGNFATRHAMGQAKPDEARAMASSLSPDPLPRF